MGWAHTRSARVLGGRARPHKEPQPKESKGISRRGKSHNRSAENRGRPRQLSGAKDGETLEGPVEGVERWRGHSPVPLCRLNHAMGPRVAPVQMLSFVKTPW